MRIKWKWFIFSPFGTCYIESESEIENVVFHGKAKLFQGKSNNLFTFLLEASYMQKTSEFESFSFGEEI